MAMKSEPPEAPNVYRTVGTYVMAGGLGASAPSFFKRLCLPYSVKEYFYWSKPRDFILMRVCVCGVVRCPSILNSKITTTLKNVLAIVI